VQRASLVPHLNRSPIPANSDYYPYVDLNAGRARYKRSQSNLFGSLMSPPLPVIEMLAGDRLDYDGITSVPFLSRVKAYENALWIYRSLVARVSADELGSSGRNMRADMSYVTGVLRDALQFCSLDQDPQRFRFSVFDIMSISLPPLSAEQGVALVDELANADCAANKESVTSLWFDLYRAVARRDATTMAASARRLFADDVKTPRMQYDYLVTAAMLGDLVSGRNEDALAIWNLYSGKAYEGRPIPGHVKLLSSIALDSHPTPAARE
jgi:hypothetical protein